VSSASIDNSLREGLRHVAGPEGPVDAEAVRGGVRQRVARRRRRCLTIRVAAVTAVVVFGGFVAGQIVGHDGKGIRVSTGAPESHDARVPSIKGLTVADARTAVASAGFALGLEPRLDSDDGAATVVAQEPAAGTVVARGAFVGVRTAAPRPSPSEECASARTALDGVADGLPAKGQTDLEVVWRIVDADRQRITDNYGATSVVLAHRGGKVYRPDGTANPALEQVDDYEILVELPASESCPTAPVFWQGIPLAFVPR